MRESTLPSIAAGAHTFLAAINLPDFGPGLAINAGIAVFWTLRTFSLISTERATALDTKRQITIDQASS